MEKNKSERIDISKKASEVQISRMGKALQGATVEARLNALSQLFGEGDFLVPYSVFLLTGVSPFAKPEEPQDVAIQRSVIGKLARIYKSGEGFVIRFQKPHEVVTVLLPIFRKNGNKREVQGSLDLEIENFSKIELFPSDKGVKVKFEGIKVGKGWLKLPLPSLVIKGDWGHLMGFKFYLAR
ncbi:hypothetical protein AAG747_14440 [Rapidithrix thailandica]|uniref:Uncharacterized protein n=1 Tax=Rapidithrix thailandica TaxID=413964 RepID=A0AAW9S9J7_9BACT